VVLATFLPRNFSAIRYRKYSAKAVATRDTRMPQRAGPPPRTLPTRMIIGKTGKNAVLSGARAM
jgi:hypothetical protein